MAPEPPTGIWPIVRTTIAHGSPAVKRLVWQVGAFSGLMVALQIWDSRNARGAAGLAELLSIAMREVDGFDVARHLPAPRPLIIFQTAHRQFAVDAFEHDALDYVVKPVTKERLAAALERARARLASRIANPPLDATALDRVRAAIGYTAGAPARLLVRYRGGHLLTPLADIQRFSAADGVVYAHTPAGTRLTDYTLNELEIRTDGRFVRASRRELVNLAHVHRVVGRGDGSLRLVLSDGSSVRVSRRRAAAVKQLLK
jgi:DNA-binding LytR/AlgR family response regulator